MKPLNKQILAEFYGAILNSRERPQVYYKIQADDLYIVIVVKNEISPLEEKVYRAEWKALEKYPNININVRVVPKFNFPIYKIIPEGFSRYTID